MGEHELTWYGLPEIGILDELSTYPCEPPPILFGPDDIELTGRIVASRKKKSRRSDWWRTMRLLWCIDWRQERRSRRNAEKLRRKLIKE